MLEIVLNTLQAFLTLPGANLLSFILISKFLNVDEKDNCIHIFISSMSFISNRCRFQKNRAKRGEGGMGNTDIF